MRLLQAFYAKYDPHGKGARSSIARIVATYRNDRLGLNKALHSKYGYCLDDVKLKPATSSSRSALEETLYSFYSTFAPSGNWSRASIRDVASAYENRRTELNAVLRKKYGKDLEDLLDAPPTDQQSSRRRTPPSWKRKRSHLSVDERWDRFAENPVPLWLKLDRWMGMYISFNKMTSKKSRL